MSKIICAILASLLFFTTTAIAQTCAGTFPNPLTTGSIADATQVMANFNYLLTCLNGLPSSSSTRQTVSGGPVTTAGLPNFLPATAPGLSVASINVTSTYPLAVTAANNADSASGAQKNLIGFTTTNLTWGSLTASATNYLYVTVGTGGVLTTGVTTVAPIYQQGGAPATANKQFTFSVGEMRGYLGNGSTAPQTYAVFVGEAVTSATTVTSTAAYVYNGLYAGAFTTPLPSSATFVSANHNLGTTPRLGQLILQCLTAEGGYAVGDQIIAGIGTFTTSQHDPVMIMANRQLIGAQTGNTLGLYAITRTGGGVTSLTAGNWKYMFTAQRGW